MESKFLIVRYGGGRVCLSAVCSDLGLFPVECPLFLRPVATSVFTSKAECNHSCCHWFTSSAYNCGVPQTSVVIFRWRDFMWSVLGNVQPCMWGLWTDNVSENYTHQKYLMWFDNTDSFQIKVYASGVLQEAYFTSCLKLRYCFSSQSSLLKRFCKQCFLQHSWCRNVFCGSVVTLWARKSWENAELCSGFLHATRFLLLSFIHLFLKNLRTGCFLNW